MAKDESRKEHLNMSEGSSGKDVFRELEMQNPAIAQAFRTFRQRGGEPRLHFDREIEPYIGGEPGRGKTLASFPHLHRSLWPRLIAFVLLLIGIMALGTAVGPSV